MLLADKNDLQEDLKRELILLEEKELKYFISCCNAVGTQAAVVVRTQQLEPLTSLCACH